MSGGGVTPSPTPAEPNLFYRVCPVNDIATPIIVDENGEVCYVDHGGDFSVLRYNVATGVITEDATDAVLTACETFTGGSYELELSTDASGNTVYTNGDYHIAVNNSGAIVDGQISEFDSQNVIAVDGAVQVFADQECRNYWDGSPVSTLYARVNQEYGVDDAKTWGENFHISTPTTANPSAKYRMYAYVDLDSGVLEGPIASGSIVPVSYPGGDTIAIANPQIIFRDE